MSQVLLLLLPTLTLQSAPVMTADPEVALAGKSSVAWCPAFQLAWDTMKESMRAEAIILEDQPKVADALNGFDWDPVRVLPGKSTYATAGFVVPGMLETIRNDLLAQFGEEGQGIRLPDPQGQNQGLLALGVLVHRMEFSRPFYRSTTKGMSFEVETGAKKVAFFGVTGATTDKFSVPILEWKDEDHFTISLSGSAGDRIVMTKGDRPESLAEGIETQRQLMREPVSPPEGYKKKLQADDTLQIPFLECSVATDFEELKGKRLQMKGVPPVAIIDIYQTLDLRLDEKGARVRSVGGSVTDPFGPGDRVAEKVGGPRNFLFNKPFFLSFWRPQAKHPYLAMWVGDTDMMEPFDSRR